METVAKVHQTISTVLPASARGVSLVLHLPNSTFRKIPLDFANKFLIDYDEDSSWPLRILWAEEAHFTLTGNRN